MTETVGSASPHVLIVVPRLAVGGTERHLLFVLPRLVARGFRLSVCATGGAARLDDAFRQGGVEVLVRRSDRSRGLGAPGAIAHVWRMLRRLRPDLVHFSAPEAYLLGGPVAARAGPDLRLMSRRSLNAYQQRHPVGARVERWLHRRMTAILGNSRAVCDDLRAEGVPEHKLGMIPNGVDTALYRPGDRTAARVAADLPAQALVLTTVANFYPYKGHADLFEALARAGDRLPTDWLLLLVGRDAGAESELRAQADRLGIAARLRWLGEREDVLPFLHASDVGLLCSHEEGFPNTVLEGMACGLPMLVTDVGGSPEAVVDRESGRVVPSRDPGMLAEALVELANDRELRERMGAAGRARVLSTFDLDRCVDDYERLYRALLDGDPRTVGEVLAAP